jgi:hypothetical protein
MTLRHLFVTLVLGGVAPILATPWPVGDLGSAARCLECGLLAGRPRRRLSKGSCDHAPPGASGK